MAITWFVSQLRRDALFLKPPGRHPHVPTVPVKIDFGNVSIVCFHWVKSVDAIKEYPAPEPWARRVVVNCGILPMSWIGEIVDRCQWKNAFGWCELLDVFIRHIKEIMWINNQWYPWVGNRPFWMELARWRLVSTTSVVSPRMSGCNCVRICPGGEG
jgi:hypothetical protein